MAEKATAQNLNLQGSDFDETPKIQKRLHSAGFETITVKELHCIRMG